MCIYNYSYTVFVANYVLTEFCYSVAVYTWITRNLQVFLVMLYKLDKLLGSNAVGI